MGVKKRLKLRDRRIEKELTQVKLAAIVGVSVEQIKSLEYGRVNPSLTLMYKICAVLESTPEELFGDIVQVNACITNTH